MTLLPFFEWCERTAIGESIRNSLWLFAVIEAFHLAAFAVIGGAVLALNLRYLGLGLYRTPVWQVTQSVWPWLLGALAVMLGTGIPLFLSEAIKCYYSYPFRVKMIALLVAIIFTFALQRPNMSFDDATTGALKDRLIAGTSLILWGTVAWAGRWIGFAS